MFYSSCHVRIFSFSFCCCFGLSDSFIFFHILPVSQHVSILIPRHPWDPVGCGKSFWGIQIPYGLRAHDLHAGGAGNGWHWKPPGHELFPGQGWLVCNFYCKQQSAKEVVQVVRSLELQPVKICLNLGYVTVFVHQKPVTCCHLLPSPILRQNLAVRKNLRAWAGGVVASWRRPCRDGTDGGPRARDSTLHSSALSIHQHPVYSSTREVCPSSKESYILSYMFCLFLCQFVWTIWTSTSWWIKCARWWNWTAQDLPKSQHMDVIGVMDVMDVMDRKVPWNSTEPREVPC